MDPPVSAFVSSTLSDLFGSLAPSMIYVDELPNEASWGKWRAGAHMLCTDIEELHGFAARLGLKRIWFQDNRLPHYDLTRNKRRQAIGLGAVQIESTELPDDLIERVEGDDGSVGYCSRGDIRALREFLYDSA